MESSTDSIPDFAGLWVEYATKMAQAGMMFDPSKAPPELARQMRSMTFAAMASQAEEFMRSPQFLAMMKQSMDAAVTFRKQLNDMLTAMQHGVQGVARQDVDSLMLTMRHIETRLLDSMEQIGDRLDAISKRLDALEQTPAPAEAVGPQE